VHELPLIADILEKVLAHAEANGVSRVVSVRLKIGALCDAKEYWLNRYFTLAARGTPAEGASLALAFEPAKVLCAGCGREFELARDPRGPISCPSCGSGDCSLVAGTDYFIESMEAI
jgi:hydrogenase nickel incorporation protein HypA/HybF